MGNPSWGKGYHTGYADGAKTGGLIGAGVTLTVAAITVAAHWGYNKIKSSQAKKREQELLSKETLFVNEDDEVNKEDEDLTE